MFSDLKKVVENHADRGIESRADLGKYHQDFCRIAEFLQDKKRISEREQYQLFMKGFLPKISSAIHNRLHLKNLQKHYNNIFTIKEVYTKVEFILIGSNREFEHVPMPPPVINTEVRNKKYDHETVNQSIDQAVAECLRA